MIIQYIVLLLNSIVCKVGDIIDSGFANSLSLGVICIFGILSSIKLLLEAFYEYGIYYFRMTGIRAKAGLYLNTLVASIASIILIIFHNYIRYIFTIDSQYERLLSICTIMVAVFFPFEAASNYLANYMIYIKKEKLCSILNVIYYIFMCIFDAIAVLIFKSAILIIIGTSICNIGYDILAYNLSGIKLDKYVKGDLRTILVDGFPLFFNRLISHSCILLINMFGSKLGTVQYAIVVISRKSLEFGQQCIRQIYPIAIITLRGAKCSYKKVFDTVKPVLVIAFSLFMISSTISIFIIKGDLTIQQVFLPCLFANVTSSVTYFFYLLGEIKMMSESKGNMFTKTGVLRFVTTIILCLLSTIDSFGLIILFYSTLTDLVVGYYSYVKMNKY